MPFNTFRPLSADLPTTAPMLPTPVVFEKAAPQKWEYRLLAIDPREEGPLDETRLAELGAEGWLLAGIVQHPAGASPVRICYYFVRAAGE